MGDEISATAGETAELAQKRGRGRPVGSKSRVREAGEETRAERRAKIMRDRTHDVDILIDRDLEALGAYTDEAEKIRRNRCGVCAHPAAWKIDQEIMAGRSALGIGERFGFTGEQIRWHRKKHLETLEVAGLWGGSKVSAEDLIGEVERIRERQYDILAAAEEGVTDPKSGAIIRDAKTQLAATAAITNNLGMHAKMIEAAFTRGVLQGEWVRSAEVEEQHRQILEVVKAHVRIDQWDEIMKSLSMGLKAKRQARLVSGKDSRR